MKKMKHLLMVTLLSIPMFSYAGWLSFLGDAASISSALNSGQQSIGNAEIKAINTYLWKMVKTKKYVEGYEFLAEALEVSSSASYLDTAAQAYFDNGQKEKAIALYETRILPIARVTCKSCIPTYKRMVGLKNDQKIPYNEIYKTNEQRTLDKIEASKSAAATPAAEYAIWAILAILILNLLVKFGVISPKSARPNSHAEA